MCWNILSEPAHRSEDCQASAMDLATQAVLTCLADDRGIADEVIPAES